VLPGGLLFPHQLSVFPVAVQAESSVRRVLPVLPQAGLQVPVRQAHNLLQLLLSLLRLAIVIVLFSLMSLSHILSVIVCFSNIPIRRDGFPTNLASSEFIIALV
jgi:hypothetical protein